MPRQSGEIEGFAPEEPAFTIPAGECRGYWLLRDARPTDSPKPPFARRELLEVKESAMAAKKRAKQPEKQRTRGGASAPAAKSPRRKTAARKKDSPEHRPAEPDTIESATVESSEPEAGDGARQFPVVGIGASAGGLEALRELLEHLPTDTGMAFVFCQHLSPQHKSDLPDILGRSTKMPVLHISDGTRLKPDHLFVLPPNHNLEVMQGTLHLMCFEEEDSHRHLPVDHFFRSLAADMGPSAIGVILSGTGSDGTLGLREIKSAGGLTLVQSTETARYGGMPASAADDVVDFRLSPRQIAEELAHIGNLSRGGRLPIIERPPAEPPDDMQKIFLVLRRATGVDFSLYKQTTVSRRIARRMLLQKRPSRGGSPAACSCTSSIR